ESAKRLPHAIAVEFCALAHPSREDLPRMAPRGVNEQSGAFCLVTHVTADLSFAAAHFQSTLTVERAMEEQTAPGTHGLVLNWAARYDFLVALPCQPDRGQLPNARTSSGNQDAFSFHDHPADRPDAVLRGRELPIIPYIVGLGLNAASSSFWCLIQYGA